MASNAPVGVMTQPWMSPSGPTTSRYRFSQGETGSRALQIELVGRIGLRTEKASHPQSMPSPNRHHEPVLYLLRHGEAEDREAGLDDAARRLTEKGERQALAAGMALKELGIEIDACLASPKVRARETARIACGVLEVEVEEMEALRGGPFDALGLVAGRGDVLLVGHEPDFSAEVGRLTGANITLKKGGIAVVDGSTLVALWRPKEIKRIAG